jgi:thermitase
MHRPTRALALAATLALCLTGTASAAYDRNTVIVKFDSAASGVERSGLLQAAGAGSVLHSIRGLDARVVRVRGADPARVAQRLERSGLVEYAEVNEILTTTAAIPNDPRFGELYGLNNTGQTGGTPDADIDAPEGWEAAGLGGFPSSGGVKVGIVDTGIRATHEDLGGKVVDCARSGGGGGLLGGLFGGGGLQDGSCPDDNGHGTHVAGTVSANANNGRGVTGVAFDAPLSICKALGGALGSGSTSDVANCIGYLHDRGAKVISMSLGGGQSTTLRNAVQRAYRNGAANGSLLVAAAGNDGNSTLNYPAAYPEVVSVAATDDRDRRASFSNTGSTIEVAAPGVNTLSTWNSSDTSYRSISGTSMATPHVAGVGALIARRSPGATVTTIRAKLQAATDDLGPAGRDTSFGFGRVNLLKAATG